MRILLFLYYNRQLNILSFLKREGFIIFCMIRTESVAVFQNYVKSFFFSKGMYNYQYHIMISTFTSSGFRKMEIKIGKVRDKN